MTLHARKPCKDCGAVLTLRHFYPHPNYRDGRMNTCKRCKIVQVTENRELKCDYYRAKKREISARQKYREQRAAYRRTARGRTAHRAACRRYHRMRKLFEARA